MVHLVPGSSSSAEFMAMIFTTIGVPQTPGRQNLVVASESLYNIFPDSRLTTSKGTSISNLSQDHGERRVGICQVTVLGIAAYHPRELPAVCPHCLFALFRRAGRRCYG